MFHRILLKAAHTTDTLCPTCAAMTRYVHPASRRRTMQPRSNGRIATTGATCLGQSIAGWHSEPLWQFSWENTPLRCRQRSYTVYWYDCLGTPYCDMCVSFGLNLLSYIPTMINYLSHQFAIQCVLSLRVLNFFRQCITGSRPTIWLWNLISHLEIASGVKGFRE